MRALRTDWNMENKAAGNCRGFLFQVEGVVSKMQVKTH